MQLVDTHCHLEMSQFDEDREAVIKRAREAGVRTLITIGSDIGSNPKAMEIAQANEDVYCSVGIHPHDAKDFSDEVYRKLSGWSDHKKVVAIGETGLDYHYDHSPRDIQRDVMRRQLGLALEKNLPVIVHSREAHEDSIAILEESGVKKGVMHFFSGDIRTAERIMSMGLYISIAGPVTFKKSTMLKEVARLVPDDYILLETDSPYLAPEPRRGKRNEPSYLLHTATEVAALRGVTLEDIARITTLNAMRLFGVGSLPDTGTIAYKIRDSLYLNITNRCTNRCSFCVRFRSDFVKGHNLRLREEPTIEELKAAIKEPSEYKEVVFCGYGEPFLRLDLVKELSSWIKQRGGRVRVNTNGHGNLINKRNILPELSGIVDELSVSLDAQDAETYDKLCLPSFEGAFEEVIGFIREANNFIPSVQTTVVDMEGVDMDKCRELASNLGVPLRVRKLHTVG
jgi:TatD DNase family protein